MADVLRSILEFLVDVFRFGAVFLVGIVGGGIAGFVLGRRTSRGTLTPEETRRPTTVEASRTDVYRAAVEAAWADRTLSASARDRLEELERRLVITEFHAEEIEREVMGHRKDEIQPPPKETLGRYRAAVAAAGAGSGLEQAVKDRLVAMETEFGLSDYEADGIEREVLGTLKEEIEAPAPPTSLENGSAQYLAAVKLAWADHRLNRDEERQLSVLEGSLGLEEGEADGIESEVMGDLREETVRDDPPPDQWAGLVEECVELVEEFDRNMTSFDEPRRDLADHTIWRLAEVLERSGVDLISDDETFDKKRHQPVGGKASPDALIEKTLSPGFAVGRRVLRRARVKVGGPDAGEP